MNEKAKPTYEELEREVDTLKQIVLRLESKLTEQDKRIKTLEDELSKYKKNSSNSSKPPSSDIVKPPRETQDGVKRKIGAQPGHPKHERPLYSVEQIDNVIEHHLDACPGCGGALLPSSAAPRVIQQIEIIEKPVRIDEHRGMAYWCPGCQKVHYAPMPPAVERGGLAGPRLTALASYMKGGCHMSYSTVQAFLYDVAGVTLSRGQIRKLVGKTAAALDVPYKELLERLPTEALVNVDETGHKENGARFWTWCFRAKLYVLFKIDKSRGSNVLIDTLGEEFNGVLGCDYFSAYRKYMGDWGVLVQFCLAHLIRDIKFLISLFDRPAVAYGKRLLNAIRKLFSIIHHRNVMSPESFQQSLAEQRDVILFVATSKVPRHKAARNLAARFLKHGDAYFRFITTPGIEPTNNIAEQAIRFVVIDRLVTQGTRSERGRLWCERIWTVMATCAIHNRSPFDFLVNAIKANFFGSAPPSLLPSSP